jgi:hypothetical protein
VKLETFLTNKKLLLSLAVVAGAVFLISIGVWLENKIVDGAEQNARMYQTATQTKNDKEFNYSIDTKQGNMFGNVTVRPVDLVKFPEMSKEFPRVHKEMERYTQHEREVCETKYRTVTKFRTTYDEEGNPTTETYEEEIPYEECHTETYYTWDTVDEWDVEAKEVDMAGRKYPLNLFSFGNRDIDAREIIPGATGKYVMVEADHFIDIDWLDSGKEGDVRYSYEVLDLPQTGTVFLNSSEALRPVHGSKISLSSTSAEQQVTDARNAANTQKTIFRVFWVFLVLAELFGLGYLVWIYEDY